jgi:hypothetical protein
MSDNLDHDVRVLREWLRRAWQFLADPSSTRFERREIRNSMREAEVAVRAGSKAFPTVRRQLRGAERASISGRRLDFRVIKVDA